MIINRMPVYLAVGLFLLTMYGLFYIKDQVMMLRFELKEIKRQISSERDSIHILKAELAYLSSPERLSKLNENYLKLDTANTEQIVRDPIHWDKNNQDKSKMLAYTPKDVKWHYKRGCKYIMQASSPR